MNRWQIASKIRLACDSLENFPVTSEEYLQAIIILELSVSLLTRFQIGTRPPTAPQEQPLTNEEVERHATVKCGGLRGDAGIMARELLALRKKLNT